MYHSSYKLCIKTRGLDPCVDREDWGANLHNTSRGPPLLYQPCPVTVEAARNSNNDWSDSFLYQHHHRHRARVHFFLGCLKEIKDFLARVTNIIVT